MKLYITLQLFTLGFLCVNLQAKPYILPGLLKPFPSAPKSNGINPKEVGDFWLKEDWHQVNVQYRKDSGEQRFIYANQIAWQALKTHSKMYPVGAMFGKVAFNTKPDEAFPNSLQPQTVNRIQLMKKDGNKERDGWSYALYLGAQPTMTLTDNDKKQETCHGCHTLVSSRDFVFARPAFFNFKKEKAIETFASRFKDTNFKDLSGYGRAIVGNILFKEADKIKYLSMPLFVGSLYESISPLVSYAKETKSQYFLLDEKSRQFLFVYPVEPTPDCPDKIRVVMPQLDSNNKKKIWQFGNACDGENKWFMNQPVPYDVIKQAINGG